MADDIAVRLAKAAAAGGPDADAPPLLVLGEGDDKVSDVFGTVVGRGTIPTAYGEKPTLILRVVQAPLGTPRAGEHALAMWSAVQADRLDDADTGWRIYAKVGELKASKGDPARKWRDYLVSVEPPATDTLGQLVEQAPERSPEAPGYGAEPPF